MNRRILQLAIPLIISNITAPLLGMVDTGVLGHLPHSYYLAGAGIGASIINVILWMFGFLRMSTTGLVAQQYSTGNISLVRLHILRGLFLSVIVGIVLLVLRSIIIQLALHLMHPDVSIAKQANLFLSVLFWGLPFALGNYVVLGALIGLSRPKQVLITSIVMNVIGIILDIFLVNHLGFKTAGVAYATVTAYVVGFVLGSYFLNAKIHVFSKVDNFRQCIIPSALKEFFVLNRDIFIRTCCLIFVFTYFTRAGVQYGQTTLSSNIVLMSFFTIFSFAADGFANAAEVLVGESLGVKNNSLFQLAVFYSLLWGVILSFSFVLIYGLFADFIIGLLTSITAVYYAAIDMKIWITVLPLIAVWGFLFDGIYIGVTMTREMRNTMVLSLGVFVFMHFCTQSLLNQGLWLSFLTYLFSRGVIMAYVLISKKQAIFSKEK